MIRNYKTNNSNKNFYQIVKRIAESVIFERSDPMRKDAETEIKNKEDAKKSERSNSVKWTDVAMVIISGFLAYFTFQLFNTASEQSKSAQQAANAAIRAIKQDSANVAYNNNIARVNDILSRKKDSLTINLANRSLQAQINSLKQAQKNFEIQNMPFLEISQVQINAFEIGKQINLIIHIKNLGNYPAKLKRAVVWTATKANPPDTAGQERQHFEKSITKADYISKEMEGLVEIDEGIPLNSNRFDKVKNGNWWLYLNGIISYENLVTHKEMKYKFMFRIKTNNDITIIYSEN